MKRLGILILLALAGCAPEAPAAPAEAPATAGAETPAAAPTPVAQSSVDVRDPWVGLIQEVPVEPVGEGGVGGFGAPESERCEPPSRPPLTDAARAPFERALVAARSGDDAGAMAGFEEALSADPAAAVAAYNLGVLAARRGDAGAATGFYQHALALAPGHEGAARGLVSLSLARGDVNAALALIEPLARAHPSNPYLAAVHGEVLVAAGRNDEAWSVARAALACDERFVPGLVVLIRASLAERRTELAKAILAQALSVSETSAELHYLRGLILLGEPNQLREARAALRRAVELRPDYAAARFALGRELLEGGVYEEATTQLELAQRLAPDSTEIRLALADAYRAGGRLPEALAAFTELLRRQPGLAAAHYNLALVYAASGASLPGLSELDALRLAVAELEAYERTQGATPDETVTQNLGQWRRQIERIERRQAMEAAAPPAPTPTPDTGAEPGAQPGTEEGTEPSAPPPEEEVEFF